MSSPDGRARDAGARDARVQRGTSRVRRATSRARRATSRARRATSRARRATSDARVWRRASDARVWRATPAFAAAALLAFLALAACGFEPLYAARGGDGPRAHAAAIEIAPVRDRIAHVVRNHLIDGLTPDGPPARPDYRLTFTVERSARRLLVQPDDRAIRYNLTLRAEFALADKAGKTVYGGAAQTVNGFNVTDSRFDAVVAEEDAARKAARLLSDEIRALILVHFTR